MIKIVQKSEVSVDPLFELKADHSPRLNRWTVVQRKRFWIYRVWKRMNSDKLLELFEPDIVGGCLFEADGQVEF